MYCPHKGEHSQRHQEEARAGKYSNRPTLDNTLNQAMRGERDGENERGGRGRAEERGPRQEKS